SRELFFVASAVELGVSATEDVGELVVQHPGAYLEQLVCSPRRPAHLLPLHHPLAHDLVDRRLGEGAFDGAEVEYRPAPQQTCHQRRARTRPALRSRRRPIPSRAYPSPGQTRCKTC